MYKEIYDDYIALNSLQTNKVIDESQRQLCLEELRSRIKSAQQSVHLTAYRRAQIVGVIGWVIALIFYAVIIGGR